jgi:hypothetical protein
MNISVIFLTSINLIFNKKINKIVIHITYSNFLNLALTGLRGVSLSNILVYQTVPTLT